MADGHDTAEMLKQNKEVLKSISDLTDEQIDGMRLTKDEILFLPE